MDTMGSRSMPPPSQHHLTQNHHQHHGYGPMHPMVEHDHQRQRVPYETAAAAAASMLAQQSDELYHHRDHAAAAAAAAAAARAYNSLNTSGSPIGRPLVSYSSEMRPYDPGTATAYDRYEPPPPPPPPPPPAMYGYTPDEHQVTIAFVKFLL